MFNSMYIQRSILTSGYVQPICLDILPKDGYIRDNEDVVVNVLVPAEYADRVCARVCATIPEPVQENLWEAFNEVCIAIIALYPVLMIGVHRSLLSPRRIASFGASLHPLSTRLVAENRPRVILLGCPCL